MLIKLLKYEFKAMGRILIPFYGALILLGLISSVYALIIPEDVILFSLSSAILIMLFIFMIIATMILSFIMTILRFKKNLLGREGYLMNTLPVTPWQNISAKLITAIIFQFLAGVAMFLAIIAFILPMPYVNLSNLINGFAQFYNYIQQINLNFGTLLFESILLGIISAVSVNLSLYAAMCIGHSFNSQRVLMSIIIYILFYIVSQFVHSSIIMLLSIQKVTQVTQTIDSVALTSFFNRLLIINLISEFVLSIIFGFLSNYFLKKKLNLQ